MKNCLIVKGGSVTGLRTSGVDYKFTKEIAIDKLRSREFIAAFDINPIKALQEVKVKIEGLPSTTNKPKAEFLGYKSGFDSKGKGSNEGDGKDKAMREVADAGFIGELTEKGAGGSSTSTSFFGANSVKMSNTNPLQALITDNKGKTHSIYDVNEIEEYPVSLQRSNGSNSGMFSFTKGNVMLARNGELNGKPLMDRTKESILSAKNKNATFVVGDMPGVDTQFIEYLIEIGAKFEVYHTGNQSRIDVESMIGNTVQEAIGDSSKPIITSYLASSIEGTWTRESVERFQDRYLYLFGDNTNDRLVTKHIPTSTQAVIRGLPNAIGIDTKKDRGTKESSYFTDADFDTFKKQVDDAIEKAIETAAENSATILIPKDGIGTGAAQLEKRAPKLFKYLQDKLDNLLENSDVPFSKFDTESNPTQDFKDLIQSLSDKLGVPVKYDNNLPYAGAFIDGNVVLNPSKMDETTVWHEFAHPFVQAVRKQNKPLYDSLVNEIYNTPHGKALLKEVQSLYGEKNQKIQEEEVIVELIARYASGKIDGFTAKKYKSIWDKVKDFIRSIGKMMFKNNDVVDTSAVNVFTMNPDMSIKDLSKVLKHSEIIWFSEKEEDFNNYDRKLLNLENLLYFAKKDVEDKKNEIEAYKEEPNYKIDSANKFLKTLEEEVLRIEKELLNLEKEKGKGFKNNQQTVKDLKGVYHNIGAYMNNAGISTIKESVSNIVDLLKAGKKIELAAWNGRGSSLMAGDILLSFKPQAIVKDTYVKDAFTELSESDSEGNRERFSPNTHLRDNDSSKKIDSFDYSESIMTLNKTNLRSIWVLQNDSNTESWLPNLKELSDFTGAPIINKATNETIYTPENKVEYQPEIYESRFGNKDINKESLKSILSDYGISYDSFSPQLKSQIETKLTNNPELLNDSNFIKSLTC